MATATQKTICFFQAIMAEAFPPMHIQSQWSVTLYRQILDRSYR